MRELVQLKGARSGVLAEVDDEKYLQAFAEENLIIGVTGSTRQGESLCFTFVDNGEGQCPDDFEDTFLDDIRRLAAQGAATVMMSIAKTLPAIVNPATVSDPDD